jgi:hypothetical protein
MDCSRTYYLSVPAIFLSPSPVLLTAGQESFTCPLRVTWGSVDNSANSKPERKDNSLPLRGLDEIFIAPTRRPKPLGQVSIRALPKLVPNACARMERYHAH